ncbi:MAG: M20/M25/M40 family metallo-hydrolase [Rhodobacteraceae bacterium]|nr:M20/M25/M40 family metallo-hydrolase [Paracoccaceae bacterium]
MAIDRIDTLLEAAEARLPAALGRLMELIRLPSVSTDPARAGDCRATAEWLRADLAAMGAAATLRETPGLPMVVAHLPGPARAPHVLFYGHYDVQPAGDPALWDHLPFAPRLETQANGEIWIRGRGASDDKGALMTFVEATRLLAAAGPLPCRISFLFEGEEESGSASLAPFLAAHGAELKADVILVCDSDQWDATTPAITILNRGICGQDLAIRCADRDLHSGIYGNGARNAAEVLARILASLKDEDGSVAIAGFYDGVEDLPEAHRRAFARLPFDPARFLGEVGLTTPAGERDRPLTEQLWSRPSAEIHGLAGGYAGEGFKAIVPHEAVAKLAFRLVRGQDPLRIRDLFRAHVLRHLPADARATFTDRTMGLAYALPPDFPLLAPVRRALVEEWGEVALMGTGGSLPILPLLCRATGAEALLVGFASLANRIHAPNEKFDLESFRRGIRSWLRILVELGTVGP